MFKRHAKVVPMNAESDAFTISTGLHSVFDASAGIKLKQIGNVSRDLEALPGTSGQTVDRFPHRRISVLPEVNSSSSPRPFSG